LWRAPEKGAQAAAALQLTAQSAKEFDLIDEILPEPFGGAHRDPQLAAETIKTAILSALDEFKGMSPEAIKQHRYDHFRSAGYWESE
jgi:acetyl-CoA carboxylase carboxyl transferase subunit alpha